LTRDTLLLNTICRLMNLFKKTQILFIFLFLASLFLVFTSKSLAVSDQVKISTSSDNVVVPAIVSDTKGYMHTVWQEMTPGRGWSGLNPGIFYSKWNGDTWSAPLKISENTAFAEIPSIAADLNDTIHVVWDDEGLGLGTPKVAYKTRASNGTWSSIEQVTSAPNTTYNWNSRVAVDNSNNPHVTFAGVSLDYTKSSIYWTKKSGTWSTPEVVSQNASLTNLTDTVWSDIKSDTSGNIYLIYWSWSQGIFYRKYTGTWSTPLQITPAQDVEFTKIAVTPGGQVFVAWVQVNDLSLRARWTQAGVWQAETTLATDIEHSFWGFPIMGVTTDSKERAHVGWGDRDPIDGLIDLKYKTFASGTWGPIQEFDSNNVDADNPYVFPDKWDNQHFVWSEKRITQPAVVCPTVEPTPTASPSPTATPTPTPACVDTPAVAQWELQYRVAEGTIQTVGTGGGTVTANPQGTTQVTLTIPNGALSSSQSIAIQIGPVPEAVGSAQVTIPRSFTFRPNGLTFSSPASAVIRYTDTEIGAVDEALLKPWLWDSQTATWSAQLGTNNTTANTITVSLSHFSLYGISAPKITAKWLSPTPNQTVKSSALNFEFQMTYLDGSLVTNTANAERLLVKVKNEQASVVDTLSYGPSGVTYAKGKESYQGVLNLNKNGYTKGKYTIELYLSDALMGKQNFVFEK